MRYAPLLALAGLALARPAAAQTAAPVYDYTTLNVFESNSKAFSKILISPPFQGKEEVQLEDFNAFTSEKNKQKIQANAQAVNQQLSDLSAGGWELVQVYPMPTQTVFITRYLLRKARR